jgi:hypothetical protein
LTGVVCPLHSHLLLMFLRWICQIACSVYVVNLCARRCCSSSGRAQSTCKLSLLFTFGLYALFRDLAIVFGSCLVGQTSF